MDRDVYLELTPPALAREKWLDRVMKECDAPASEKVYVGESGGRVTAEAILAARSSPAYNGAAMDGYALRAEDSFGASPRKPVRLEISRGAWPINTGQPLPPDTDAVAMIENTNREGDWLILEKAVFPWQHVRKTGEDIVETEVILPPGTLIGPTEIGALAAGGVLWPPVFKRARVTIIPSGSDLSPLNEADEAKLRAGEILPEFNSLVFSAMLKAAGANPIVAPIAPDDPESLTKALRTAAETSDLILLNAGTSAGSRDYSAQAIASAGEVIVRGVAMMPGKPATLGIIRQGAKKAPVAAIPGYPVSAYLAIEEFVLPLLAAWQKRVPATRPTLAVHPVNPLPSRPGMEERVRVKLGEVDGKTWAVPLPRGAGTVTSLSRADAIITIPPQAEGLNSGEPTEASLLREPAQIAGALLAIGSHDNALDLIDSFLRKSYPRFRLNSAHVGSLGGLLALAKGQAHIAGSHLLDPESGVYNRAALRQYLRNAPVVLLRLVKREQGLILPAGNPLRVRDLKDVIKGEARFINRQRGSGTRALLDYELEKAGLRPDALKGYEDEEYTHMNVAQAVLAGRADVGLGARAAANALNLDFIPVALEDYDLVIPQKYLADERMKALIRTIRSREFRDAVTSLGGYDLSQSGEIIYEQG